MELTELIQQVLEKKEGLNLSTEGDERRILKHEEGASFIAAWIGVEEDRERQREDLCR